MHDLAKHVTSVLDCCILHLDLDVDGAAVNIVRIGIAVC